MWVWAWVGVISRWGNNMSVCGLNVLYVAKVVGWGWRVSVWVGSGRSDQTDDEGTEHMRGRVDHMPLCWGGTMQA